jgi:phosphoglycolate phosphatase
VTEALDFLKTTGVRIGCVTNKASQFTLPLLKDLGVHDYFEIVICGDMLERKKPDPMPLLHAAEQLETRPVASLMIGDSMSDVKAARAAGFRIVCMSYGYNHGEDIRDYNPDAVVDSMAEIKDIVDW